MTEQERQDYERLRAAEERFLQSAAWRDAVYDNRKIMTDEQGRQVLVARRHDDHLVWDVIAS